eukprot:gnl/TRDRNA2_/TRDRNA2_68960_c0_seq1.p1 gnl/TRDRNA2_/TRDRNA2_68960_c0~~gnl/TRDRNA2_/TRDRNA2_68960_c0_seq1.p1  ORF type:complete len:315 (-),score=50.74 gnl/TRDRNA2_/TRDRNA2_68960_c0_seq1:19-963(-)
MALPVPASAPPTRAFLKGLDSSAALSRGTFLAYDPSYVRVPYAYGVIAGSDEGVRHFFARTHLGKGIIADELTVGEKLEFCIWKEVTASESSHQVATEGSWAYNIVRAANLQDGPATVSSPVSHAATNRTARDDSPETPLSQLVPPKKAARKAAAAQKRPAAEVARVQGVAVIQNVEHGAKRWRLLKRDADAIAAPPARDAGQDRVSTAATAALQGKNDICRQQKQDTSTKPCSEMQASEPEAQSLEMLVKGLLQGNCNSETWASSLRQFYATSLIALLDHELATVNNTISEQMQVLGKQGRAPIVKYSGVCMP